MSDRPQTMPPYALLGRIVTMDDAAQVIRKGAIYIRDGRIVEVAAADQPAPAGFENCLRLNTRGTIYPGLIELHNHLSYNILPLWNVPKKYSNRAQWIGAVGKQQFISGPMQLLNAAGGYLGAIIRYVEAKCLLAGVTTSQGLTLMNASGIEKKYRGVVRNAEEPDDATLPKSGHRIADVDPDDLDSFLAMLKRQKGCYLLHLSEGVDERARQHFLNLQFADQSGWAITDVLAGIHAAGLQAEDFAILQQGRGAIIWSPLSNLLLYGETAQVQAAKQNQVPIALGSDWSPSGSKNLLGELKVAKLYSQMRGNLFTDLELVRMATSTPAKILRWGHALGTIEPSKLADLFVVSGQRGDPYRKLIASTEADIQLVVIGGIPRYGTLDLMQRLGQEGEAWQVDGQERLLNLDGAPDADVSAMTLKEAVDALTTGLARLPNPPALQTPVIGAAFDAEFGDAEPAMPWRLALDNDGDEAHASRFLAPLTTAEVIGEMWAAAVDLRQLVTSLDLDELTVADNPQKYLEQLAQQANLPAQIKNGLPALYGL
ncbi:MAG TPA: amidohydrolase family protein [Herpetosiphonaceae bacterium]